MNTQTDNGLLQAYEFLKIGDPARAKPLLEDRLEDDLENGEILFSIRCVNFWIDQIAQMHSIISPFDRGERLMLSWKHFITDIAGKDGARYERSMYAVRKGIFSLALENFKPQMEDHHPMKKADAYRKAGLCYKELGEYVKLLKKQEYTDEHNFMLTKYYQRFLHPLTCVIFAAIGCLLGFSPPRSQRLVGFTIGVGMIFAYYITLPFFDLLAQKGVLFPFLAAAFPIIVFVAAIFVIKKARDL